MTTPRCLVFGLLLASAQLAAQSVRLLQVPDPLTLPAVAGSNPILEVEVAGSPRAVWLAAGAGTARAALTDVGERRFQCNLAAGEVEAVVRAAQQDQLFVFAQRDGEPVRSAPIAFRRRAVPPTPLTCTVRFVRGGLVEPVRWRRWYQPDEVGSIDIAGAGPTDAWVAVIGDAEQVLSPAGLRDTVRLELDGTLRAAWEQHGRLALQAGSQGQRRAAYELQAIPARLALPNGTARFSVQQRRSVAVPGSRGWWFVDVGDITAGQALLTVRTAGGDTVVDRRSVHAHDHVAMQLAGEGYELVVRRLVNLLIGDDFADLEVVPRASFRPDPIGELLQRIAASDATFVREGRDYDGVEACAHLRRKLDFTTREVSLDEFIDEIAGKSSATGGAYEVRTQDGKLTPMRDWLRAQLALLEAARQAKSAKGR